MAHFTYHGDGQKLVGKLVKPLLVAGGTFYLIFHVLIGEHGVYALLKEQRKLEILNADIATVTAQRKTLEHRVRLMSAGSLDLDLLDEQSRRLLGDAREDEVVIPVAADALPATIPAGK